MEQNIIKRSKSSSGLCDDIVTTILARLPVQTLIRFTCVSKSWNFLIRHPTFIAVHTDFHKERGRYLLYMPSHRHKHLPFVTIERRLQGGKESAQRRSNLKLPFDSHTVVGSCEGLVCVQKKSEVCLWNPLLGNSKILPPSPSAKQTLNRHSRVVFGLGYSCKNNDHRIVKIVYTKRNKCLPNKVEIYSLKSDSWKSIDCPAPALVVWGTGVFINGRINWLAFPNLPMSRSFLYTIMWFDIDKELFGDTHYTSKGCIIQNLHEWPRLARASDVHRYKAILKECEEDFHPSFWKMKSLACENSWVDLDLCWVSKKVHYLTAFDGETMLETGCSNDLISVFGFSTVGKPWEEEEDYMEFKATRPESLHVFCVSESLSLLDHQ